MAKVTGFPPSVLAVVHGRSDWVCELCGMSRAVEHHHRRARGMGSTKRESTNAPSACLHACRECHRLIESHRNLARACGWLVDQYSDPASVPVIYRGTTVWLDDLGNMREAV